MTTRAKNWALIPEKQGRTDFETRQFHFPVAQTAEHPLLEHLHPFPGVSASKIHQLADPLFRPQQFHFISVSGKEPYAFAAMFPPPNATKDR